MHSAHDARTASQMCQDVQIKQIQSILFVSRSQEITFTCVSESSCRSERLLITAKCV